MYKNNQQTNWSKNLFLWNYKCYDIHTETEKPKKTSFEEKLNLTLNYNKSSHKDEIITVSWNKANIKGKQTLKAKVYDQQNVFGRIFNLEELTNYIKNKYKI